jgi:hypothetical protein
VTVYDEDMLTADDVIGRVTFSRADLERRPEFRSGVEQWLYLSPVDDGPLIDVSGQVRLGMTYDVC